MTDSWGSTVRPELVIDASVLIHCEKAGLLDEVFALPVTWMMADISAEELGHPAAEETVDRGMVLVELSTCLVSQVETLRGKFRACSIQDLSGFVLARSQRAILVTSDGPLRTAADSEGLRCHGTLWVLDQLVAHRIISGLRAVSALRTMRDRGARLPEAESQRHIEAWRRGTAYTHEPMQQ